MKQLSKNEVQEILKGDKNLAGCDLTGLELWQFDFTSANLQGARLESAEPYVDDEKWYNQYALGFRKGPVMPKANLANAHMRRANLRKANLREANLTNADLRGADLSKAFLRFADLTQANLCGAKLAGADLSRAILTGVIFDDETIWPDTFVPEQQAVITEST